VENRKKKAGVAGSNFKRFFRTEEGQKSSRQLPFNKLLLTKMKMFKITVLHRNKMSLLLKLKYVTLF